MYPFNYHRPATLDEAEKLLSGTEDAQLLAGGMTLLPTMKMRLAQPSDLVDLGGIEGLAGIEDTNDALIIGAMTRHCDVVESEVIQQKIPALSNLASQIGDAQVRNRGTLGGSVSNNDPAADYPAAVLGLGATITTNRRKITADEFFIDLFETALEPGEILLSIRFPVPQRAAYIKFPNPASRYAIAGVMVAKTASGVRVAVTGASPCVFRLPQFEKALEANFSADALEGLEVDPVNLNEDLHATPQFRAHLAGVMARRAVTAAGG